MLAFVSSSASMTLKPAGLDKSVGIVSVAIMRDPNDPQWDGDEGTKEWRAWMGKYYPDGDRSDVANIYGYLISQTLVQVLRQCGDDLSRANIMRQAANLHDLELPMLLPGIRINTSPTDYRPVKQMQPIRFNGHNWELFGNPLAGSMPASPPTFEAGTSNARTVHESLFPIYSWFTEGFRDQGFEGHPKVLLDELDV